MALRTPSTYRGSGAQLAREQSRRILEGLELERVVGWVVEEHRRLLAHLAGEAYAGLDDELHGVRTHAFGELVPLAPIQHDAEMRHRHVLAIDDVVVRARPPTWVEMRDQLVAEEIEIHPGIGAASFRAAQQLAVEGARGSQVMHRYGKVKRLHAITA
jgi:hypothetical protein